MMLITLSEASVINTGILSKRDKTKIVELNASELRLLVTALMNFRNKVARAGKLTEDINELILMVTK